MLLYICENRFTGIAYGRQLFLSISLRNKGSVDIWQTSFAANKFGSCKNAVFFLENDSWKFRDCDNCCRIFKDSHKQMIEIIVCNLRRTFDFEMGKIFYQLSGLDIFHRNDRCFRMRFCFIGNNNTCFILSVIGRDKNETVCFP